jgi:hypothetical protein
MVTDSIELGVWHSLDTRHSFLFRPPAFIIFNAFYANDKNEDFFLYKKKIRINQDSKFEKTKIENGCFYL